MLENFLIVAQQVLVLFILIGIGFVCGKKQFISDTTAKNVTDIILYVVTPCVIIESFQREFDSGMLYNLGISAICAVAIHVGTIIICHFAFRKGDDSTRAVLKFGTVFSNCGFMSIPLQMAVLGADGVFYGGAFLAVFNITLWTYGLFSMSGSRKAFSFKSLILNPGILGVIIALFLYIARISLPEILLKPVSYLAALNTPVPMLIIGYYLSKANLKHAFTRADSYLAMGIRLIVVPVLATIIMYACGIRGVMLVSSIISCSAPIAAATTMFSAKFNKNTELSVSLVSASTLVSLVTMPLVVGVSQLLA